jgi:hypothetical protein
VEKATLFRGLRTYREKSEIYTGEYLNIQFNSTCRSGCSPTTPSQPLQPGKRYQFKSSGISGSKIIQLVDFPR